MALDLSNLYAGYLKAATYNPVTPKVIRRGLKPFHLKPVQARGKSDTQLQRLAARRVIRRFQRQNGGMRFPEPITPPSTFKPKRSSGGMKLL